MSGDANLNIENTRKLLAIRDTARHSSPNPSLVGKGSLTPLQELSPLGVGYVQQRLEKFAHLHKCVVNWI